MNEIVSGTTNAATARAGNVHVAGEKVQMFGIDIELAMRRIGALWSAKRFILSCAITGLILSLAVAFVIPVKYEATAVLMPPDSVSTAGLAGTAMLSMKASSALGSVGSSLGSLLGGSGSGQLVVAALQTEALEDRIIDHFHLQNVYHIKTMRDTRKKLERRTDISEDVKSGLITIAVKDRDPKRAAEMANDYGEELEDLLFDVRMAGAKKESDLLKEPLQSSKKELDESVKELSEFSSKNTTLDPDVQGKAMVDAAAMLQGQLVAAQAESTGLSSFTPAITNACRPRRDKLTSYAHSWRSLRARIRLYRGKTPWNCIRPFASYPYSMLSTLTSIVRRRSAKPHTRRSCLMRK